VATVGRPVFVDSVLFYVITIETIIFNCTVVFVEASQLMSDSQMDQLLHDLGGEVNIHEGTNV
jgi:hypothetical protein